MLQPLSDLDESTRIRQWLAGRIAYDPVGGYYLLGSNGRRTAGRPQRYFLCHPTKLEKSLRFTATSNTQAINKGNDRIAKKAIFDSVATVEEARAGEG